MDNEFLDLYNQELKFIRESGAEFAQEYPKIAGRLGLEGFDCSDPYVERLFEGFAFLSARVQRKLNAAYPEFTQHLMELLFPTFLQPIPSMLVSQFQVDSDEASLLKGYTIPRGTALFSQLGKDEQTPCEYTTTQDTTLWPIELTDAEYISTPNLNFYLEQSKRPTNTQYVSKPKSAIKLSFALPQHLKVADLPLDSLQLHMRGSESLPFYIYEALCKGYCGLLFRSGDNGQNLWRHERSVTALEAMRFKSEQAMLPFNRRQFDGFRLLREYFSFPQAFLFTELQGLRESLSTCTHNTFELLLLLDHSDSRIENKISAENFALHCAPAINLFEKRAERISLASDYHDLHVTPSKMSPLDYEVCSIEKIEGFGDAADVSANILPLYSPSNTLKKKSAGFYTLSRKPRLQGIKSRKFGHRSSYVGSEVYLSLCDPKHPPFSSDIKQLSVTTMCCNRDLPLMMPLGKGSTDFSIETGAPCSSIRCVGEPTRPLPSSNIDETAWDLISLLSVNFLGFTHDEEGTDSAVNALIKLLSLMSNKQDAAQSKQLDGIVGMSLSTISARLPFDGPICFGRGVQISLQVDESAYQGGSVFLLGMVLDQFFSQYVSINSFTQLVLISSDNKELHKWPIRIGSQSTI